MRKDTVHLFGLVNDLLNDGQSRDEHVPHSDPPARRVFVLYWRSAELTELLMKLDALHMSTHFKSNGKPKPGRFPEIRKRMTGNSKYVDHDATPVRGLPRNCYDQEWLDGLSDELLTWLAPKPEVDLSLSENAEAYVTSCGLMSGRVRF